MGDLRTEILDPQTEPDRPRRPRRPHLVVGGVAFLLVLVLLAAGGVLLARYTGGWPIGGVAGGGEQDEQPAPAEPVPPLDVTVTPDDGATAVRLDAGVRVTAGHGELTEVRVAPAGGGQPLAGELTDGGRVWESTGPLAPGATYQVTWVADDEAGEQSTATTSFATLAPTAELTAAVAPLEGETVGVGQPIVLYFSQPVANKAEVERALTVQTSRAVVGSWSWFGDEQVRFRPQEYWPANTRVRLVADLAGVDAGNGVWGVEGRSVSFSVGRRQISTANVQTHQMTVEVDGRVVRTLPISAGRPEFATRNGVHTILSLERNRVLDSDTVGLPGEYEVAVEYALRLTNTGTFVHAAPWSVGSQGRENVSHGCINLSTENAAWFYDVSQRGDLVEVVGSSVGWEVTEGMLEWNRSFEEWRQGSALPPTHNPVRVV